MARWSDGPAGLDVAVVGAGIGGLTLAAALTAAGVRCRVFEQARRPGEVGAGIQVAPNAARLLHRLGLERPLRAAAVRPEAIEQRRWDDDRLLARTVLGESCVARYGAPYYTVHRADLHEALSGLVSPGVVRYDRRLTGVEEVSGGVVLRFHDGSAHAADAVVGADGIHSVVRASLVADRPVFSGQSIYRGLVPGDRLPELAVRPKVRVWLGPGQHCVCYAVSGGRAISFAATVPSADGSVESWSAVGDVRELEAAYRGWNEPVTRLIRAAGTVRRWALHDREPLPRWSGRRVTLLGDAAHPMLPFMAQGANQAIEDAAALAACLVAAGPGGVPRALRRYEEVRAPRAMLVQSRSRASARELHMGDGTDQLRRDERLGGTADLDGMAWLYGYDAERAVAAGVE